LAISEIEPGREARTTRFNRTNNYREMFDKTKGYGVNLHYGVVVFVQHLPTKGPALPRNWLSFVA
jgi:hypothetical protein